MIDWGRVETLFEEIGEEDFFEVVQIFLEESDSVIARLETAPDPDLYEEDLHFLKGSALNLGFSDLAALCQVGERQAAAGSADCIDIGPILQCYGASVTAFAKRGGSLSQRSSAA
jgi:HPt (histidine-containing phosphotransfer) domain-containing protein